LQYFLKEMFHTINTPRSWTWIFAHAENDGWPTGLALLGMGGPGPGGIVNMPYGTTPSMPWHNPMRPSAFLQQGNMDPQ
jgi:hypothetical protein